MNSKKNKMHDPYDYFRNNLTQEEEQAFINKEQTFYSMMQLKQDMLTKQLWRELEYYQYQPSLVPIRIDDHIYYRRVDNIADAMTLYRFPIEELAKWHDFSRIDCDDIEQEKP